MQAGSRNGVWSKFRSLVTKKKSEGVTYNANLSVRTVQNDFHHFLSFGNQIYVLWKPSLRFSEIKFTFCRLFNLKKKLVSSTQDRVFL